MLSCRICFLRKKHHLSQAQLAEKLSLSASAISMYERGAREPSVTVLIALASVFGVTLDYLITGKEGKEDLPPIKEKPHCCYCGFKN